MKVEVIRLEKSRECYECEINKKEGSLFNCHRCIESHFVCMDCIPTYLNYEIESGFEINQLSENTRKEFQ